MDDDSRRRMDLGLLILRMSGALLLLTFGLQKVGGSILFLRSGQPWSSMPLVVLVRQVGFPMPEVLTVFAVLCESVMALLVACGLATRAASICVALSMAGALYTSIRIHDPLVSLGSAIQYILVFGALAIMGPGRYTVGRLLGTRGARV